MLKIKNLSASIENENIIKNLNLEIKRGEVHAIMGPNGSGKSTLAKILAGHPSYEVTNGSVEYEINGTYRNLLELEPHERALEGIFLGFQYPVEIPGVTNSTFLRETFNQVCVHQGAEEMDAYDFNKYLKSKLALLKMDESFLSRPVNLGFSGGEKKKNEILQLTLLNPRLALLDETDSGLDVDALKIVAEGVNNFRSKHNAVVLVTHYQRLLDYIRPDFVHILSKGQIVKSGDAGLALEVEKMGYEGSV